MIVVSHSAGQLSDGTREACAHLPGSLIEAEARGLGRGWDDASVRLYVGSISGWRLFLEISIQITFSG